MKAVLDTNVIISAYMAPASVPGTIIERWGAGAFEIIVSERLLAEYRRVMSYPRIQQKHRLTEDEIDQSLTRFRKKGIHTNPGVIANVVAADSDDDIFVACAVDGNADYIVSGDRHLLDIGEHEGIRVLRPVVFLALLDEEAGWSE